MKSKQMSQPNPSTAKMRKKMPIILIGLLAVIAVASLAFLVLVARLSVEDADLWLRPITGILLLFTFVVGGAMLFTGYLVVDKLGIRVAKAQTEASNAKELADQEAIKRLELEESIAPRILTVSSESTKRLKAFKDTPFVIECVADGEAERVMGQVKFALEQAGWKEVVVLLTASQPDGIRVERKPIAGPPPNAASELVSFLEANGWEAAGRIYITGPTNATEHELGGADKVPDGTVRVRIGLKPSPYFLGKLLPDTVSAEQREAIKAFEGREKERRDGLREEWGLSRRIP